MREPLKKLGHGILEPLARAAYAAISAAEYRLLCLKWRLSGHRKPEPPEVQAVCENVTFLFKSFERQRMAKQLYRNIQAYFPGAKVVIADDSRKPLKLRGKNLTVLQLPFRSGLSYGLNRALEQVMTPFLMRMDDDELLTPCSKIERELAFLHRHPEVDLVGFGIITPLGCRGAGKRGEDFARMRILNTPKPFRVPHMTAIDGTHFVVEKPLNVFLARTQAVRRIGWDDRIQVIDHHEFFYRAAGELVCAAAPETTVFHRHNPFQRRYMDYRMNYQADMEYIRRKRSGGIPEKTPKAGGQ